MPWFPIAVEVRAWMSNHTWLKIMGVITYPCLKFSYTMFVKGAPMLYQSHGIVRKWANYGLIKSESKILCTCFLHDIQTLRKHISPAKSCLDWSIRKYWVHSTHWKTCHAKFCAEWFCLDWYERSFGVCANPVSDMHPLLFVSMRAYHIVYWWVYILKQKHSGFHYANIIFKCIFFNEKFCISNKISYVH